MMSGVDTGLEGQMERLGGMKIGYTWTPEDDLWLATHKELVNGLREVLGQDLNVKHAWLFGSVALGTDREGSDVDVVVDVSDDSGMALRALRQALEARVGRRVNLVVLSDLEAERRVRPNFLEDWGGRRRIR
jgi:predicted nucleotidyltransferase